MPASAEVQGETLQKFIAAWKRWNAEDWLATFADDFTQVTMPFGLGVPARSRSEVEQVLPKLMQLVQNYEVGDRSIADIIAYRM